MRIVEQARDVNGVPLTKGQIQLKPEAAECLYNAMKIRPITALPDEVTARLRESVLKNP